MRTTLTIQDDVAKLLERVRKDRNACLKTVINEALRIGLTSMAQPDKPHRRYKTRSKSLGRCLVGNIDDIAEVIAHSEGDAFN